MSESKTYIDKFKLQYLKQNGFIEFDKQELKEELESKHVYSDKDIENWINKYKYYRLMSDGEKMFYSIEYVKEHTIEEIEEAFQKIS